MRGREPGFARRVRASARRLPGFAARRVLRDGASPTSYSAAGSPLGGGLCAARPAICPAASGRGSSRLRGTAAGERGDRVRCRRGLALRTGTLSGFVGSPACSQAGRRQRLALGHGGKAGGFGDRHGRRLLRGDLRRQRRSRRSLDPVGWIGSIRFSATRIRRRRSRSAPRCRQRSATRMRWRSGSGRLVRSRRAAVLRRRVWRRRPRAPRPARRGARPR